MKKFLVALLLLASPAFAGPRYDVDVIGGIDMGSMADSMAELLSSPGPEVSVRINSPGGNPLAVLLFNDLARDVKVEKHLHVTCVGTMMVASAAALLFESDFCDVRVLEPATMVLFHEAALSTPAEKKAAMEDDIVLLHTLDRILACLIAPRLHMTVDAYLSWIHGHDRWLSADFALELGMADRVEVWAGRAAPKKEQPPL